MTLYTEEQAKAILDKVVALSTADDCTATLTGNINGNIRFALNAVSTSGIVEDAQLVVQAAFGNREGTATTIDVYSTWKLVGRESVTVPAGTFNACKFEITAGENSSISGVSTDTDLTGTAWTHAPVGLVKQVTTGTSRVTGFGQNISNTLSSTQELLSATMGGQTTP